MIRFNIFYTILVVIDLIIVSQRPQLIYLEYIIKPSLMIALGFYFYQKSHLKGGKQDMFILSAIIFSLLGDVALMFEGGFLAGLGAFLIAHIFYIVAFSMDAQGSIFSKKDKIIPSILILIYGAALIWYLYPHLGAMKIPVIIYASTILTMLLAALNRLYSVGFASYMWVMVGAMLFVISDSLIALGRFAHVSWANGLLVMLTYAIGQFFIIEGYLKNHKMGLKTNS